ncbi:KilA-N domain-containing protein [Candidatus Woesearchaeota archaeon]|nr:KilA-N domain-containing protein [Candidatus Woesearchaeota archaeon]
MNKIIKVEGYEIGIKEIDSQKYISLTDIARKKNPEDPRFVVINWLRNRNTVEFLGIWEKIHNPNFNRVGFDTVRLQSGLNSFTISPSKWIELTNAMGIISKSGKYDSGTYAHEDIALEFASWISAEFKLYFIKEFRRLKYEENERLKLGWNVKRELVKINYKIHTDAIKENLIPPEITPKEAKVIYASEADVLNKALFGKTAKEWSDENHDKKGNMRDYANVTQLVVLANLESLNSEFIKQDLSPEERLIRLNKLAISQMTSLVGDSRIERLEKK